jgi:hypothetical protein
MSFGRTCRKYIRPAQTQSRGRLRQISDLLKFSDNAVARFDYNEAFFAVKCEPRSSIVATLNHLEGNQLIHKVT